MILFTCEAKYVTIIQAIKKLLFFQRLTFELKIQRSEATILYSDNEKTIKFAHNSEFHARIKHIDIQQHFIREIVNSEVMNIK
jgi:hypothetical protein